MDNIRAGFEFDVLFSSRIYFERAVSFPLPSLLNERSGLEFHVSFNSDIYSEKEVSFALPPLLNDFL